MQVFEVIITLLLGGALLAALARRIGAPYPALVALAGAALALVPGVPTLVLDPELALALFVAPVLVDAAFDSSLRDLRANWRPVMSLALGAVVLTVLLVATVAHLLVPEMTWAAAIALGAIVAPPDAAAATAVLKQLRPPYRLIVIVEGESLFNDASALLIYRLAVGAAMAGALSGGSVLPTLLGITAGSVFLGIALAWCFVRLTARVHDMATMVILQFCGAFGIWILAEQLHLSGIVTCVIFAMSAARMVSGVLPARMRIQSWAVWEVAVFVLNVLAFVLVGLQLRSVLGRASGAVSRFTVVAATICAVVILARMFWVTAAAAISRYRGRNLDVDPRMAAVVGWCGMRGTVTLATALALPTDFPQRDLILFTAFAVTLGTLVIQGFTLKPMLLWLRLRDDGQVDRELLLARFESLKAAVDAIASCEATETTRYVQQGFAMQLRQAEQDYKQAPSNTRRDEGIAARVAVEEQRRRLRALRAQGTIGDVAYQQLESELDWMELGWEQALRPDNPNSKLS